MSGPGTGKARPRWRAAAGRPHASAAAPPSTQPDRNRITMTPQYTPIAQPARPVKFRRSVVVIGIAAVLGIVAYALLDGEDPSVRPAPEVQATTLKPQLSGVVAALPQSYREIPAEEPPPPPPQEQAPEESPPPEPKAPPDAKKSLQRRNRLSPRPAHRPPGGRNRSAGSLPRPIPRSPPLRSPSWTGRGKTRRRDCSNLPSGSRPSSRRRCCIQGNRFRP